MGLASLILLIVCGIAFAGGGILLSRILARRTFNPQKGEAYECGVPTIGQSWIRFNVGYYLFALLFLIFDVELVFLYPWAVVVKDLGMVALFEVIIFLFIIAFAALNLYEFGRVD